MTAGQRQRWAVLGVAAVVASIVATRTLVVTDRDMPHGHAAGPKR